MKKFISMLAVSAILVGCLAGCGNSAAEASTPAEETTQAATEAPAQETEALQLPLLRPRHLPPRQPVPAWTPISPLFPVRKAPVPAAHSLSS